MHSPSSPQPLSQAAGKELIGSRGSASPGASELGRSAVVFSPHPDDESLGCGGTILKKKQAGATVKLVHVSDGGGSTTLIPRDELTAMRKQESLNAGRVLGVDDIYFLDFPDGHLGEHMPAAIERVAEILRQESPEEVFVPYCREPMKQAADHVAVTNIVLAALRRQPKPVTVWEYPVWFWLHWPWVGFAQNTPPIEAQTYLEEFSFWLILEHAPFWILNIRSILPMCCSRSVWRSRQHKSQTEKLIDDPGWVTLEAAL